MIVWRIRGGAAGPPFMRSVDPTPVFKPSWSATHDQERRQAVDPGTGRAAALRAQSRGFGLGLFECVRRCVEGKHGGGVAGGISAHALQMAQLPEATCRRLAIVLEHGAELVAR